MTHFWEPSYLLSHLIFRWSSNHQFPQGTERRTSNKGLLSVKVPELTETKTPAETLFSGLSSLLSYTTFFFFFSFNCSWSQALNKNRVEWRQFLFFILLLKRIILCRGVLGPFLSYSIKALRKCTLENVLLQTANLKN